MEKSRKTFEKLGLIEDEAKKANTKAELHVVWSKLLKTKNECWNRELMVRYVLIRTIIETKYSLLDI